MIGYSQKWRDSKSKAVLVIDMSQSCDVCDFTDMENGKIYCGVHGCGKNTADYIACRPDWCPLVPMPEKLLKTGEGWVDSWNAAIDAIGGKDEQKRNN